MKNKLMDIKKTKDLLKLIESLGYNLTSRSGSHMVYRAENKPTLSIPDEREISRGTLRNIVKLIDEDYYNN
jgi:predicted RNA binding protein YcfA (HicA-like mRNA interferase family)